MRLPADKVLVQKWVEVDSKNHGYTMVMVPAEAHATEVHELHVVSDLAEVYRVYVGCGYCGKSLTLEFNQRQACWECGTVYLLNAATKEGPKDG